MNLRAQKLVDRVEKAHQELMTFIKACSQEEWERMIPVCEGSQFSRCRMKWYTDS